MKFLKWSYNFLISFSLILLIIQCRDKGSDGDPVSFNLQDFEVAWNHIDTNYPLFEFKSIDWDEVYITYRTRVENSSDDDMITILSDLVGELKDGHAKLYAEDGTKIRPYTPPRRLRDEDKVDNDVIESYFINPPLFLANGSIMYQFLNDSIGYVRIPTFGNPVRGNEDAFETVITYFEEATGLVVDVRENDGGGGLTVNAMASHLISETIPSGYQLKLGEVLAFAHVDPHPTVRFNGSVAVLINGGTFSAGEVFAYKLRNLERITLVGDTTAGGGVGNNSDPFLELPSGKAISINDCAILRKDSVVLEWNGVPPDRYANHTLSAVANGKDLQLEDALELLSN